MLILTFYLHDPMMDDGRGREVHLSVARIVAVEDLLPTDATDVARVFLDGSPPFDVAASAREVLEAIGAAIHGARQPQGPPPRVVPASGPLPPPPRIVR